MLRVFLERPLQSIPSPQEFDPANGGYVVFFFLRLNLIQARYQYSCISAAESQVSATKVKRKRSNLIPKKNLLVILDNAAKYVNTLPN